MTKILRGLFLNIEKDICSIYESGKMCFDCLVQSKSYTLDYVEVSKNNRQIDATYDFYIYNYHFVKMKWLDTNLIKNLPGFKITIVLEMSQNNPFDCVSKDDFDAYMVLDPTCNHFLKNVYAFPRPLEVPSDTIPEYKGDEVPVIGTFGLSFSDKGFDEVIRAVNEEFESAIVKINVPDSGNVNQQVLENFETVIAGLNIKEGIRVEVTNHYFTKEELINWCAQNTLNVFLYNRRVGNGLSATTDQAISSGRPLAISTNPTFRHIHTYIKPYPYQNLKESIDSSATSVKKIQEDWSPNNFILQFESVLKENNIQARDTFTGDKVKLPIFSSLNSIANLFTRRGLSDLIPPILLKGKRKIKAILNNNTPLPEVPTLRPFVHQALQSGSQFQEDLLIDLLLNKKMKGVYVDVGANDPFFNSNTWRFYLRGWRGINIEPGLSEFKKIAESRKFDINLNMAVSNEEGELTFYQVGNDSSLSTLDRDTAIKMMKTYKLPLSSTKVEVMPLCKLLDTYLGNRHIDFMSVDAEGHDLAVLKSNDWDRYRPTLVMVESNIDSREIIMFMDKHDYLYIFSNHVNALFMDKKPQDKQILYNISWSN